MLRDLTTAEIDEIVLRTATFYHQNPNNDPSDECEADDDDDDDDDCEEVDQDDLDDLSSAKIEALLRRDSGNNTNSIIAPLLYCRRGCMVRLYSHQASTTASALMPRKDITYFNGTVKTK